jgi:dephospho-CoA kinase
MVVGILGGIASGKSFVTRELVRLGAAALDADRAGHEVLAEPAVKRAIRDKWGDSVFQADGEVDRAALADRVFAGTPDAASDLAFLESLTHPRIGAKLQQQAAARAGQGVPITVLDAAVLLKAGWDQFCDLLVFVETPFEVRLRRAAERGWDAAELRRREGAQVSLEEKKSRADFVIDNSGDEQRTLGEIRRLWQELRGRQSA